jgi:CheY-like chemotaxis protein
MVAFTSQYKDNVPSRKILVVEDNALYREYVKGVLGLLSLPVEEAENGLSGLEKSLKEDFDLIITDLMMPEMDGITFIEEIKKAKPATKIIAMSAGGRNANRESYFDLAAESDIDGFLQKPFQGGALHSMVKEIFSIN